MHHKYGPSGLESLEKCPRFRSTGTSEAAESGNRVHEMVACGITKAECYGSTDEEVELAEKCEAFELRYCEEHHIDNTRYLIGKEVILGQHLSHSEYQHPYGTADWRAIPNPLIEVVLPSYLIDWKTGTQKLSDAVENLQVQSYAWLMFLEDPRCPEVNVALYYPRYDEATYANFTRDDYFQVIESRVHKVIERCENPHSEPCPGEICQWCSVKAGCPAMMDTALTISRKLGLPIPENFEPKSPASIRDRVIAQLLASYLGDWSKQVKALNTRAAVEDGDELPGFSVRTRKGNQVVNNMPGLFEDISEEFEIDVDFFLRSCNISVERLAEDVATEKGGIKSHILKRIKEIQETYATRNPDITYLQRTKGTDEKRLLEECLSRDE